MKCQECSASIEYTEEVWHMEQEMEAERRAGC